MYVAVPGEDHPGLSEKYQKKAARHCYTYALCLPQWLWTHALFLSDLGDRSKRCEYICQCWQCRNSHSLSFHPNQPYLNSPSFLTSLFPSVLSVSTELQPPSSKFNYSKHFKAAASPFPFSVCRIIFCCTASEACFPHQRGIVALYCRIIFRYKANQRPILRLFHVT